MLSYQSSKQLFSPSKAKVIPPLIFLLLNQPVSVLNFSVWQLLLLKLTQLSIFMQLFWNLYQLVSKLLLTIHFAFIIKAST